MTRKRAFAEIPGTAPCRSLPTKDELVAAWLREHDVRFWRSWDAMAERHTSNPRRQLNSAFALLAKHVSEPVARGCAMANAAGCVIEAHKAKLRARLAELCLRSGARDAGFLADELFLLVEGAQAPTLVLGVQGPARNVARAAASLIDSQLDAGR